jgi:amidophosphoribosyltransferase
MAELNHECGIAAVYHLPNKPTSPLVPRHNYQHTSRLIPRLLLDIQNRGQLAAGITAFMPDREKLINTHRDVGTVAEVFRLNHKEPAEKLMDDYCGLAAIGHVRYATCGKDDPNYAQPFERHHLQKSKWFSFGYNGQLANYQHLKEAFTRETDFHLSRDTDTEIILHLLSKDFSLYPERDYAATMGRLAEKLDGAYNLVFINALGDMFISRDPWGIRPLCYAFDGSLFAAASESVALANIGFNEAHIKNVKPGHMVIVQNGEVREVQYTEPRNLSHCFFEWIYFANAASTLDDRSVYKIRSELGKELAIKEMNSPNRFEIDDDTIVVPVPDTAKGAASSMAFELKIPCVEGLMRNRYVGRTFIESTDRADKARIKYSPLPEVLKGKKVLLVEDTIVRSTTMRVLIDQIRQRGGAKEVHVRVACPPIIAPCFYGIDMSRISELFAAQFLKGRSLTPEIESEMARDLGADSLHYLPVDALARCIGLPKSHLCHGCVNGNYPTKAGTEMYQLALETDLHETCGIKGAGRLFDQKMQPALATPK